MVFLLLCSEAGPATAQEGPPANTITWEVGSPSAGFCIHFLMEPKEAAEDLPGQRLVLAREAAGRPRRSRLIADETQYAEWAPGLAPTSPRPFRMAAARQGTAAAHRGLVPGRAGY
jgi:hypothetical protein